MQEKIQRNIKEYLKGIFYLFRKKNAVKKFKDFMYSGSLQWMQHEHFFASFISNLLEMTLEKFYDYH